jgi:hypothetical protein
MFQGLFNSKMKGGSMKKIAYLLYIIFIELPPLIVFLAATTGFTNIYVSYERTSIYNMARERDQKITMGLLTEQLETEKEENNATKNSNL